MINDIFFYTRWYNSKVHGFIDIENKLHDSVIHRFILQWCFDTNACGPHSFVCLNYLY
jgi:hypothetical protein